MCSRYLWAYVLLTAIPFYFSFRLLPIWLKPYIRKFPPALTIKCERVWGTCTEAPVFALVHMRLGSGV